MASTLAQGCGTTLAGKLHVILCEDATMIMCSECLAAPPEPLSGADIEAVLTDLGYL